MSDMELQVMLFMGGMAAGLLVAIAGDRAGRKAAEDRLKWARGMVDALSKASENARAALRSGDTEAYEHSEAEFWAISAELDLHFGKTRNTHNDNGKRQTEEGA